MRIKKKVYSKKLSFDYFINVTNEGLFTAYLPEEIIVRLESCGIEVNRGHGGKKGYFESHSIKDIEIAISTIAEKFSEKKLIETKIVLRYEIITSCAYCKTKKGEIVPNGYWSKRIDKSKEDYCKWFEGTQEQNSNNRSPYGFRIFVEVQRLNIYIFPDKSSHKEYINLKEDEIPGGSTLDWLDSLTGMNYENEDDVKDIEYCEEVGLFFKNAILYICNLNEKLKSIFGEEMEISQTKIKSLPLLLEKNV